MTKSYFLRSHHKPKSNVSSAADKNRNDPGVILAGLRARAGRWYHTDSGALIMIINTDTGLAWFVWDGISRRIYRTKNGDSINSLMELLKEAWPEDDRTPLSEMHDREKHLELALQYDLNNDIDLIMENFELLFRNTDRILIAPEMLNGHTGGLYVGFTYGGIKRYSISSLLEAWKSGHWIVPCHRNSKHQAYILTGGGGLSKGSIQTYCPSCKSKRNSRYWSTGLWVYMAKHEHQNSNGLRLDEIIEILKEDDHA